MRKRLKIKSYNILIFQILLTSFVAFSNFKPILYIAQLICLLLIIHTLKVNNLNLNCKEYFLWFSSFSIWSFCSIFWASSPSYAISACISIAQSFLIGITIMIIVNSPKSLKESLQTFSIINLIMIICIIVETNMNEWKEIIYGSYTVASAEGRLGYSIGLFPNSLGEISLVFSLVLFYLYKQSKKKRYLVLIVIDFLIILFTKSRTSLFFLIFCIIVYIYINAKRLGKIKVLIVSILCCTVLMWSVLNIESLYEIIGFRIEGLLGIFNSSGYITDDSTIGRIRLLKNGIEIFEKSPLIGVGINNYGYNAFHNGNIWAIVPAHNNYIELLSGIGIIGTILYYFIIYRTLFRGVYLSKYLKGEEKVLNSVLLSLIIYRVIADFFGVSYKEDFLQIINAFCIAGIYSLWYERRKSNEKARRGTSS